MPKEKFVKVPVPEGRVLDVYAFLAGGAVALQNGKPVTQSQDARNASDAVDGAAQEPVPEREERYFSDNTSAVKYVVTEYGPVNMSQVEERLLELYVEGSMKREPPKNRASLNQTMKVLTDRGEIRRISTGLYGEAVDTEVPF